MPTPIRVGIIANPVSARDIRRVMSHAAGLPLAERANMVLRIVQALAACGVDEVWLMPETEGLRTHLARLLPAAAAESVYPVPELVWADMPVRACTQDSTRAAEIGLECLRDGMLVGPDADGLLQASLATTVPVIASGGVGTLQHLVEGVTEGHATGVLAASIFHFGEHTIAEAKAAMTAAGVQVRPA